MRPPTAPVPDDLRRTRTGAPLDPAHVAALLDMSADAIITVSPDERITSWNRGAAEMFGWAAEEVVGRVFDVLLPDDERARGEPAWIHRTTLAQGAIRDFETRRRRKDGTDFDVSLTRTAVYAADGTLLGWAGIRIAAGAASGLAATGADLPVGAAALGLTLLAAGTLAVIRRRRTTA